MATNKGKNKGGKDLNPDKVAEAMGGEAGPKGKRIVWNKGWDNLIPAKKGEPTRNPNGRPKLTDIERQAREAGRYQVAGIFMGIINCTQEELVAKIKSGDLTVVEKWYLEAILEGLRKKDLTVYNDMMDRLGLKAVARVQQEDPLTPAERQMLGRMTDQQLIRVQNGEDIEEVMRDG